MRSASKSSNDTLTGFLAVTKVTGTNLLLFALHPPLLASQVVIHKLYHGQPVTIRWSPTSIKVVFLVQVLIESSLRVRPPSKIMVSSSNRLRPLPRGMGK